MFSRLQLPLIVSLAICQAAASCAAAQESPSDSSDAPRLAFVGLHGGVYEALQQFEEELSLRIEYVKDDQIAGEEIDLSRFRIVFLQHTRKEHRDQYRRLIRSAKERNARLRIISLSGLAEGDLPELARTEVIEHDDQIAAYYGNSVENLRRMLIYVNVKYLDRPGNVLPPEDDRPLSGFYHPDHRGMFGDAAEFLAWSRRQGKKTEEVPRASIAVHATHLVFQQPAVVDALIREFEKRGVLAAAVVDNGPKYERDMLEFKPHVVIHTCHSRERVSFREELGAVHLHSIFFRNQSIDEWTGGDESLSSSEMAFHIVGQELLGAVEPQVAAGTTDGGGSAEAFEPIPERIAHLVGRACAWIRLARIQNAEKRIALVYYDREMGQAELMRGSATGMFMNGPRSLVGVLRRMKEAGYDISRVPDNEDQLLAWMMERGRQIGLWAPGVLDRLARSGEAVLVPAKTYKEWFDNRVPEQQRKDIVKRWGPPPGNFLVWKHDGVEYIVIPRIDLGNVILLPQPLRGEAHDTSLVHDLRVPPPHNYLATYFWLQEEFGADALVHFGTHGSEFLLPGKPVGLSERDWPDILMGTMPNLNPWIINNLGESSPVRRRAYAVLIDHLVPPAVNAELSDELLNLHNAIDKWIVLEDGALKEKFRKSISEQFVKAGLDKDVHIPLEDGQLLTPEEIQALLRYLHDIHNETTPVSLHIFGEPPSDDLLVPYLVTCLQKAFLSHLGEVIAVPEGEALTPGDRQKYLRRKAEEVVALVIRQEFSPDEALVSVGGTVSSEGISEDLQKDFELLKQLVEGFSHTHREIDQLLGALDGRFVPPGPGNSPDRNPAVLPTGRNMYVLNPEEVPTRPSWELGKQLTDRLLSQQLEAKGRYPEKIGFTLNSFATFQDYGVMESQILYLIGVRPVWDARNRVVDVELISAEELGRPRIDVFIAGNSYYRDMLPTRMRLIDKAIRMVAALDEQDNPLHRNSREVQNQLVDRGIPAGRAERLSQARIFGYPLGQQGSAGYYYLVERSGEWDSREELMETYLSHVRNVYTEGIWGEPAEEAYNRHIQGTDVVLRTWADRTRSPLSNKYVWYKGGSLCRAVKHLTGKEPEFLLSDVRDADEARMVRAEDALRKDFRVRLFNRKWIEGMMKEGYAGADQIAVHASNAMGWKIMRPDSVSDDLWEEIVNIYVRDSKNLAIPEWFEAENPFAYQDLNEILLETIRKGYWQPGEQTVREIAMEYARSVARHGEGDGLRGGGNGKLESFVKEVLAAPGSKELDSLLAAYEARSLESQTPASPEAATTPPGKAAPDKPEIVQGQKLARQENNGETGESVESPSQFPMTQWIIGLAVLCALSLVGGYFLKWGVPRK